jgi:hypothetical protein
MNDMEMTHLLGTVVAALTGLDVSAETSAARWPPVT